MGPPSLNIPHRGTHEVQHPGLKQEIGDILASIARLMLDFGPAHPCKPSVFPADFLESQM